MKTSSPKPSHVFLDNRLGIEKFESFLRSNDPNESKTIFAGKHKTGVMLLHRLPTQSDSKLARLGYFLRFGSERNQAREKIKDLLSSQGIELTADIRKALPSRFSNGNATQLLSAINKAPRLFELVKIPE